MLKILIMDDNDTPRKELLLPMDYAALDEAALERAIMALGPDAGDRDIPELPGDGMSHYVLLATGYINAHYGDSDISVGSIAAYLNISEGHLSRIFKKETGQTVLEYLTGRRIEAAKALLADCRVRVNETAYRVGYKDVTYFSAVFKKIVGVSPSEYHMTGGTRHDQTDRL